MGLARAAIALGAVVVTSAQEWYETINIPDDISKYLPTDAQIQKLHDNKFVYAVVKSCNA